MSTETRSEDLYGDEHVRVYRETSGEVGYRWKRGSEILLLTTKGRKSGDERTHALIFREIDGDYILVASKGGHWNHPAWFLNMEANPQDIQIQVKADVFGVRHHIAEGEERERLWGLMNEVWPDYAEYQKKTDRQIPVLVLDRHETRRADIEGAMADAEAFRSLYRAHHGRVCAYLAHRTEAGAVEDLAAETFMVAWRRQHEMPAHVLPWLLNIAGKCLANQRRGRGRQRALADRVRMTAVDAATTEEALVQEAQRRAIVAALGAVEEEQRELLLLRHWDGLAPRDIARVLELNPVAARARLHRATRRLQRELHARLEAEGVPSPLELNRSPACDLTP